MWNVCDVPCRMIWIIFNHRFDLVIINNCSSGMFSVSQFKISTCEHSESLKNSLMAPSPKRHICLLFFVILFFFRKDSGTPFCSTFTFNVKTFNPRPNHVGSRFEISPIRKCIYHNFSLRVKALTFLNATY